MSSYEVPQLILSSPYEEEPARHWYIAEGEPALERLGLPPAVARISPDLSLIVEAITRAYATALGNDGSLKPLLTDYLTELIEDAVRDYSMSLGSRMK